MSNEGDFPPGWNQEPNPPSGPPPGSDSFPQAPNQLPQAPDPSWAPAPGSGGQWGPPPGGAAPGGFTPSGDPGGPVPTARQNNSGCRVAVIVLLVLTGLVVVGIGGCTFLLVRATRPAVDVTNEFYAALSDDRYEEAYNLLCTSSRPESVAAFESSISADAARISSYNFTNVQTSNNTFATVEGTVSLDGTPTSSVVQLTNSDDGWKVCSFSQP
ncbi:MAG: hypothetical protein ACK5PP_19875 [Acidimicrobiales bacterium]